MATASRHPGRRGGDRDYDAERQSGLRVDKGIVIGIVENNSHPTRMGTLTVLIPTYNSTGSSASGEKGTQSYEKRQVKYCTPFYSRTENLTNKLTDIDVKNPSGMVFPCPDKGTRVLCFFPEGKNAEGFWFACVPDTYMLQGMPEHTATENVKKDPSLVRGDKAAATEFNDTAELTNPNKINSFLVPQRALSTETQKSLKRQGLDEDEIRGLTTSSYMRETPSELLGITTKGRRVDQRGVDIKDRKDILNALKKNDSAEGIKGDKLDVIARPIARKPGHSFVMDDGDIEGNSQLVRIRTSNGHQILLHDTEDLIYVSNAAGTAWVQFDKAGQIDLYSESTVNVRAKSMNFHADDDIRFHAGRTMQMYAGQNMHVEGGSMTNIYSERGQTYIYGGSGAQIKGNGAVNIEGTSSLDIKSGGDITVDGDCISLGMPAAPASTQNSASKKTLKDTVKNGQGFWEASGSISTTVDRAPTHEPFPEHAVTTQTSIYQSVDVTASDADNQIIFPDRTPAVGDTGLNRVKDQPNTETVDEVSFVKQPEAQVSIGQFERDDVRAFGACVVESSETAFNYDAVLDSGAIGKYGFTVAELKELGYIRPEAEFNQELSQPRLWTEKNGVQSRAEFLGNTFEQEAVFTKLVNNQYQELVNNGVIKSSDDKETVAGILNITKKLGARNAKLFREGKVLDSTVLGIGNVDPNLLDVQKEAERLYKKGAAAIKKFGVQNGDV